MLSVYIFQTFYLSSVCISKIICQGKNFYASYFQITGSKEELYILGKGKFVEEMRKRSFLGAGSR